jgi:DNA repair protein RadC
MDKFEKAKKFGVENLEDYELLMILGFNESSSKKQLNSGWNRVETSNFNDKESIKFEVLMESVRRISKEQINKIKIHSTTTAGEYAINLFINKKIEEFHIILLDSGNNIKDTKCLFKGTINECVVYPREVIKFVIETDSLNVILCHNHPGGSLNPSDSDIKLTKKICKTLETINVSVFDHIIVADNKFFSFAEKGLI